MIITNFVLVFFNAILLVYNLLHSGPITQLPFVDAYLVQGWGYINFLRVAIPPLEIAIVGFFAIYAFKVSLMLIRAVPFIGRMFMR